MKNSPLGTPVGVLFTLTLSFSEAPTMKGDRLSIRYPKWKTPRGCIAARSLGVLTTRRPHWWPPTPLRASCRIEATGTARAPYIPPRSMASIIIAIWADADGPRALNQHDGR